jgi:hypothetical protein
MSERTDKHKSNRFNKPYDNRLLLFHDIKIKDCNGYIIFCQFCKKLLKDEISNLSQKKRFQKFGAIWKDLPRELKNSFIQFSSNDKSLRKQNLITAIPNKGLQFVFDSRCAEAVVASEKLAQPMEYIDDVTIPSLAVDYQQSLEEEKTSGQSYNEFELFFDFNAYLSSTKRL